VLAFAPALAQVNGSVQPATQATRSVRICILKSGKTADLLIPGLYCLNHQSQKV
jgi:hypothetical protein